MAEASVVDVSVGRKTYIEFEVAEMIEERDGQSIGHSREGIRACKDVKSGSMQYRSCFLGDLLTHL